MSRSSLGRDLEKYPKILVLAGRAGEQRLASSSRSGVLVIWLSERGAGGTPSASRGESSPAPWGGVVARSEEASAPSPASFSAGTFAPVGGVVVALRQDGKRNVRC